MFIFFIFVKAIFTFFKCLFFNKLSKKSFQIHNTKQQNEHCLKNFDLTEYRGILSDIAIWLFQGIIKDFEKKLNPIIGKIY